MYFVLALAALSLGLGYYYALPYLYIGAIVGLLDFIPYANFRKEAAAYNVSVANGRSLESAESALSRHSYAKGDIDVARRAITSKKFLGLF